MADEINVRVLNTTLSIEANNPLPVMSASPLDTNILSLPRSFTYMIFSSTDNFANFFRARDNDGFHHLKSLQDWFDDGFEIHFQGTPLPFTSTLLPHTAASEQVFVLRKPLH